MRVRPRPCTRRRRNVRKVLSSDATTRAAWKDLTPLARNEWICWVISAERRTTRSRRIQRAVQELKAGNAVPVAGLAARLSRSLRKSRSQARRLVVASGLDAEAPCHVHELRERFRMHLVHD